MGAAPGEHKEKNTMAATVLYMSTSLDGFIAGPNEGPGNGLGDGGHRLHDWFLSGGDAAHEGVPSRPAGINGNVFDEMLSTGAVVAGRGTFEPADGWGGDHHDGVPIFVLSRQEPVASAVTSYATSHPRLPNLQDAATVHGYTVAFWWAAGIFALGLLIALLVLPAHQVAGAPAGVAAAAAPAQPTER